MNADGYGNILRLLLDLNLQGIHLWKSHKIVKHAIFFSGKIAWIFRNLPTYVVGKGQFSFPKITI